MKQFLRQKAPLLILLSLILAISGELINNIVVVIFGAVLFGVGICMLMPRTVNPDVPPPPPPKDPKGQ